MFGPTPKYRHTFEDPIDGVPMYWNLHPDGFPIRKGDTPDLVDKALLDQASVQLYHRSQIFRIPEEIDEYNRVMDWIANGGGSLRFERERQHDDGWTVWVAWVDLRGYIPSPRGSTPSRKPPTNNPTNPTNPAIRTTVVSGSTTLTSL